MVITAKLLPLLVHFTTCSDHTTHYVKPTANTPCPADPCLILSEYAQQTHHYLTSNTTLLFLPGDHVLSVNFMVENVSDFEIYAQQTTTADNYTASGSRIVCQGLVGFTFRNISHMTVHGLTFNSCGKGAVGHGFGTDHDYLTAYAVSVYLGRDTKILNCLFQDSIGTALGVFYSNLVLKGSNSFTNNCRGCSDSNYTCICSGGGIHTYTSTLIFEAENSTFTNNSAEYGGGIDAIQSTLNFTGNTTFRNNSADKSGGGITASVSRLKFVGNTSFQSNSAERFGGGIWVSYSSLNFSGNSTFHSNSALLNGGGISASSISLNFRGNTTFRNNMVQKFGGGISASYISLNFSGNTTFRNNMAQKNGGGIAALYSTLDFTDNSTFQSNSAEKRHGGGIFALSSSLNFSGNTTFRNNSAEKSGGGIAASDSSLKFTGNSTFQSNSVEKYGGGISIGTSTLNFTDNTTFRNNSSGESAGGIRATKYNTLNFNGDTVFRNNLAGRFGGGIRASESTLNFIGNTTFKQNSADSQNGGGIDVWNSTLNFIGNTTYRNNSAKQLGGGISTFFSTLNFTGSTTFRDNPAILGGGIYTRKSILDISGDNITGKSSGDYNSFTSVLMDNSALMHGGAVYTKDSILSFEGCNTFSGNSAQYYGGGIYSENSTLKFSGNTSFKSNSGHLQGGGIYGHIASIYFKGNSSFTSNSAARGGGEYLVDSFNFLFHNTVVTMDSNNTTEYGGAVYVEDSNPFSYCFLLSVLCFFQVYGTIEPHGSFSDLTAAIRASLNIHSYFYNNHAGISGSAIYGGYIDNCVVHLEYSSSRTHLLFDAPIDVLNMEIQQEPNSISSNPLQVCMCEDGIPNCSTREFNRQVYPGELLHFPVVATGQRGGVVPAVVQAFFTGMHGNTSLAQFQDTQNVQTDCTDLYYQMHSSVVNKTGNLVLYADGPCATDGNLLKLSLQFLPCPPGFRLNSSEMICGCEPRLQKYTTRCNITERTLTREGEFWVGYDNYTQALILHTHCPFDYCKPAANHLSFSLNSSDLQCKNGSQVSYVESVNQDLALLLVALNVYSVPTITYCCSSHLHWLGLL